MLFSFPLLLILMLLPSRIYIFLNHTFGARLIFMVRVVLLQTQGNLVLTFYCNVEYVQWKLPMWCTYCCH